MQKRMSVFLIALVLLLGVGFVLTMLTKSRRLNARVACTNNLREQSQFAIDATQRLEAARQAKQIAEIQGFVPAGTLFHADLAVDRRFSWIAAGLPYLNQRRQDTVELHKQLNLNLAWNADENAAVAKTRLVLFTCPANIPEPTAEGYFPTSYVGIGGVKDDAPTLGFGPPIPARIGAMQYDKPTPLQLIYDHDGLSNSAMIAEVSQNLGPWIRGGSSSCRTLNPDAAALGTNAQFGGNHEGIVAIAFCDGSNRFLTDRTDAAIIRALFTIAGKESDPLPGE